MSRWLAKIQVTLKPVVNDPQGLSIGHALHHLGFERVGSVRTGKYFEVEIEADERDVARSETEAMCRRLLANPVIEDYRITVDRRPTRRASSRRRG